MGLAPLKHVEKIRKGADMLDGKGRSVLLGLDGVPYRLIKRYTRAGVMPNLEGIISGGTFREMKSTLPPIFSTSWSSIMTGDNPGQHGIFGFSDVKPDTYDITYPNFNTLKTAPFWRRWDRQHVVLNMPFTYPAPELNGYLVSGFVAPELSRSVYPDRLLEDLRDLDYRVDVDSRERQDSKQVLMQSLFELLETREKALDLLWEKDWDVLTFVITGTDRLMQYCWEGFQDRSSPYRDKFEDYFRRVDSIIGRINSRLTEQDLLTVVSDHGFGPTRQVLNLNALLHERGFLDLDPDKAQNGLAALTEETRAFALDPGRIYLHRQGQYPEGSVQPQEEEKLLDRLTELFEEDYVGGKPAVGEVFRGDEVYSGGHASSAPDLVLLGAENVRLNANLDGLGGEVIQPEETFTGKRTYPDAAFVQNREVDTPKELRVKNVPKLAGLERNEQEMNQQMRSLGYL